MLVTGNVERLRLVALLDEGVRRPLTLVSAPPGSGKTSLLADWLARGGAPGPVAWLQLSSDDGDRRRFWSNVIAAAGSVCPPLAALAVPPHGDIEGLLRSALGALGELDRPLVIVLDDLHMAGTPEIVSDLEWLLEHQPSALRMIVATRSDPPLRLERLRVAGKLAEVRAGDLAFTLAETAQLLSGLGLEPADVELLWRRTEGWTGGLRLAELSLAADPDPRGFVAGFAGDDRAVADYLTAEVVSRLTAEDRGLLLRTSVATRVNGELADALTGSNGGARKLRELARAIGFLKPVPGRGSWYRCHQLLADVMQAELRHRMPDEVQALHRIAARWHAADGSPLEAVRHAVEGEDWPIAAEVLGEHWIGFVVRGEGSAVLELARRIPPATVRASAELSLAVAGLLLELAESDEADELLVAAYENAADLPPQRARRFAITSTATTLYRARLRGDLAEAISAARALLDEPWDRAVAMEVRALAFANLGIAEFWDSDARAAGDDLQRAAGLALECGNDYIVFLAESYAAAVDARVGRLEQAWTRAHTAIQLAERRGWTAVAHAGIAYATLATVHLWRNELTDAAAATELATVAVAGSRERLLGASVAQVRARLLALEGDLVGALDVLSASAHPPALPPWLAASRGLTEAELWLMLGEPGRARELVSQGLAERASDYWLGLARLELAASDPGAALRSVAEFFADDREPALAFTRLQVWLVDAIARDAIRDERGALRSLEQALEMAEPRGYANIVLRYGPPVRSLLRRLISNGTRHRALAGDLLAALEEAAGSRQPLSSPLYEPLSEREITVLRFLPTMMSNSEIAAEMFVSVNTVKTHLRHVYRKLGVVDRRDCVARARELRLLTPGLPSR